MGKIAFVFPGQGAQHQGMGMDVYKKSVEGKQLLESANRILDFDLLELISSENENLNQTAFTQPALLAVSIALMKEFSQRTKIKADYVAGLSLGEYSALVAAGAIDFEKAVSLVRKRGQYMEEAGALTKGSMAAVMKPNLERILELCEQESQKVVIANYNSPVQVVISGEEEAVARVSRQLSEEKVRVIPLQVSGAFHSPLMEQAALRLEKELESIEIKPIQIPYVANINAAIIEETSEIKELLCQQVSGSVRWQQCVEKLIEKGVDTFYEIGPGTTLNGLIKKINKNVKVINVNTLASIEEIVENLGE